MSSAPARPVALRAIFSSGLSGFDESSLTHDDVIERDLERYAKRRQQKTAFAAERRETFEV